MLSALAALSVLAGCSAIKLGYGQGSAIAFGWFDNWVDFDDAQSLRVRTGLDDWFTWHRKTQLPDYADLLAGIEADIVEPTTAERTCRLGDEVRRRVDTAVERVLPTVVDVALTLKPKQIVNIEKAYAKRNDDWRDDFLQPDPVKRRLAAVERDVERAEKLYGPLDESQRQLVAGWVADSPFDADVAFAERRRHQQEALDTLRRISAGGVDQVEAEVQIRAYLQRRERPPPGPARHRAEQLRAYNCRYAAALHNSTTAAQRQAAVRTLKGYETDLRALAADAG